MTDQAVHSAIGQMARREGERLSQLAPPAMLVALVGGAVISARAQDVGASSADFRSVLALLDDLGAGALKAFLVDFFQDDGSEPGGKPPSRADLRERFEGELLARWEAGGGLDIRRDVSKLLRSARGVGAALALASGSARPALVRNLAEIGRTHREYRWMLDDARQALAEIYGKQIRELGVHRQRLEREREQVMLAGLLLQAQKESSDREERAGGLEEDLALPGDNYPPYKGLLPCDPQDADRFFGRERVVAELTARLAEADLLAVIGPSGSGKTSLVHAGLLPSIWDGGLPGGKTWRAETLSPGEHPLQELADRMAVLGGVAADMLLQDLETDPRSLEVAIRRLLADQPKTASLVLVVDPLERLFTQCRDEQERRQFVDVLTQTAERSHGCAKIILILRTDFYHAAMAYPDLAAWMQNNQVVVHPIEGPELHEAIARPVENTDLILGPGFLDAVLDDAADKRGRLPALFHALHATWAQRSGDELTAAGYEATGGIDGAVAMTADGVFQQRLTPEQRDMARTILLRLVGPGEGLGDTGRSLRRRELAAGPDDEAATVAVLDALAAAGLLSVRKDVVELAHEALMREWPLFRTWLTEERTGFRIGHDIAQAARDWQTLGKRPDALFRGAQLEAARTWAKYHPHQLSPLESEFVQAGVRLCDQESGFRRRRFRLLAAGALLTIGVLATTSVLLGRSASEDRTAVRTAQAVSTLAVAEQGTAVAEARARATAQARAELGWYQADEQRRLALSRQLAAQALTYRETQYDLALLLAAQAFAFADNADTRGSLLSGLDQNPGVEAYFFSHSDPVVGISFHDDGDTVTTVDAGGTIANWSQSTGAVLSQAPSSATGERVAVAGVDDDSGLIARRDERGVTLWDSRRQEPLDALIVLPGEEVRHVALDPQRRWVALGGSSGTILLWDIAANQPAWPPVNRQFNPIESLALDPSGRWLASGGRNVVLWDVTTGAPIGSPLAGFEDTVGSLAFDPDGRRLAAAGRDGVLVVWDVVTRNVVLGPLHLQEAVESVAFSADGTVLAVAGHTITLWDVETGLMIGELGTGDRVAIESLRFSLDGRRLVSGRTDGAVVVWRLDSDLGPIHRTVAATESTGALDLDVSGELLAVGGQEGGISVWDVAALHRIAELEGGHAGQVGRVFFKRDSTGLYSSDLWTGEILLWDVVTGDRRVIAEFDANASALAFGAGGNLIAWVPRDRMEEIVLIDAAFDPPATRTLVGAQRQVSTVALSPDGRVLAAGDWDRSVLFWDVVSGEILRQVALSTSAETLSFSPDGESLAVGLGDGSILLLDAASGAETGRLEGHADAVTAIAFGPDGRTLVSGDQSGRILLWDIETSREIAELPRHANRVQVLDFSGDARFLVSGSWEQVVLHTLDPSVWIAAVCDIVRRDLTQDEWSRFVGPDVPYAPVCVNPEFP